MFLQKSLFGEIFERLCFFLSAQQTELKKKLIKNIG